MNCLEIEFFSNHEPLPKQVNLQPLYYDKIQKLVDIYTKHSLVSFSIVCNKSIKLDRVNKHVFLKAIDCNQYAKVTINNNDIRLVTCVELPLFLLSYFLFGRVSIASSFYNESNNINHFAHQLNLLDSLFYVNHYSFVDNGSIDSTRQHLQSWANKESRIKLTCVPHPSSYNNGFHTAIKYSNLSSPKHIIVTHSDCQYNMYMSLKAWLYQIFLEDSFWLSLDSKLGEEYLVFSKRLNRSYMENILTTANNTIASLLLFNKKYIDFNASPKIIPASCNIGNNCQKGMYTFDLCLSYYTTSISKYNNIRDILCITYPRLSGQSSWSHSLYSYACIIISYLGSIISLFIAKP